jgi:hypothetical protein
MFGPQPLAENRLLSRNAARSEQALHIHREEPMELANVQISSYGGQC